MKKVALLVTFLVCRLVLAQEPATLPSTRASPDRSDVLRAMLSYDETCRSSDPAALRTFYKVNSANEEKLCEAQCALSLAMLELEKSAVGRFGAQGAVGIEHSAGDELPGDIAAAEVEYDGGHALAKFADGVQIEFIKLNNEWLVDEAWILKDMTAEAAVAQAGRFTRSVLRVADGISTGQFNAQQSIELLTVAGME